jgi:hypothetical protein
VKKTEWSKRQEDWRKARSKEGPVGLVLLAEVLTWNPRRIEPSNFKELDSRRRLLDQLIREIERRNKDRNERTDWRDELRSIQTALRNDILSILEPVQLTEEDFQYWNSYARPINFFADPKKPPRENRLCILLAKLWLFQWRRDLIPVPWFYKGMAKRIKLTKWWSPLHGEHTLGLRVIEIDGDSLAVQESLPRFRDVREELYFIIDTALRTKEFSKLRICKYRRCRKVFVVERRTGKHCSDRCRIRFNNEDRRTVLHDRYERLKKASLERAEKRFVALVRGNGKLKTLDAINDSVDIAQDKILMNTGLRHLRGFLETAA